MTDPLALTETGLLALLQLASPSLPVGAYSYSQGLEAALADGLPDEPEPIAVWIRDHLELVVARAEAPVLARLRRAWAADDRHAVARWSEFFLASRESAELRAETLQMGHSAARLLAQLGAADEARLEYLAQLPPTFPAAFALGAVAWEVPERPMLLGYLWTWAENQVLAALKAAPVGQAAGQAMLRALAARIPECAAHAAAVADDDIAGFAPGLAIASCRHETLANRIFRS
jgi:urease accessory protein